TPAITMTDPSKKKFGLIFKAKIDAKKPASAIVPAVFGDDFEEEQKYDGASVYSSLVAPKSTKQAERAHELAIAEDPTIFDYDANYEVMERDNTEKMAEQKKRGAAKQSCIRVLDRVARDINQQQKQRLAEMGQFDDKEELITSSYRKQLEAVQKLREEEEDETRCDDLAVVAQQKIAVPVSIGISPSKTEKGAGYSDQEKAGNKVEESKTEEEQKAERFEQLKAIVKNRNGPEEEEELRKRYFERKVELPM
ncbi:hypothetical protein PFISCL1PPCAC_21161, partial [Pristionchus fissidentatus]